MVAGKGVAFVEFFAEPAATEALGGLKGFKLTPEVELKLNYARR
jgi:hypothetical protein